MEAFAISALAGTAVGSLTGVAASWLGHRVQIRTQRLQHEKNRRQIPDKDFIEEASKCYIDALQHDDADVPDLVGLYAKLGRMRVMSSKPVHSAEHLARQILDTYLEPDKTFVELRDMARNGAVDVPPEFSDACREEFEELRAQQFWPEDPNSAGMVIDAPAVGCASSFVVGVGSGFRGLNVIQDVVIDITQPPASDFLSVRGH